MAKVEKQRKEQIESLQRTLKKLQVGSDSYNRTKQYLDKITQNNNA